jgi:3-phenylpropionate/trans-cinnamate dioxygenase ferredoxin subunit
MARFVVAKVEDIPDGGHIVVDVNGRSVGVFNVDGELYGLLNRCPHQGGPMCQGRMVGLLTAERPGQLRFQKDHKLLACPWHGWEFDVKTGQSYFDPLRLRLRKYPVVVEQGNVVASELEQTSDTHLVRGPVTTEMGTPHGSELVKGPYTAETIEVAVEDEYVVVTMRNTPGVSAAAG